MSKIIGIDLGTTNSCAAVVDVTTPQVIPNREGSRTTPSVVGFTEDSERLVGQIAKRQAITNPFNTVFAIKRLIGRKYESDEVERAKNVLPYQIVSASNGDIKVKIRDREYSPEEISAFVLMEIKSFAEEFLGEPVSEAIITVPAYFNDSQCPASAGRDPYTRVTLLSVSVSGSKSRRWRAPRRVNCSATADPVPPHPTIPKRRSPSVS